MKAKDHFRNIIFAAGIAVLPSAFAEDSVQPTPTAPTSQKPTEVVAGIVTETKQSYLTIERRDGSGSARFELGETTLITKGDRPATVSDLRVGDRVEVKPKAGTTVAESLNILTADSKSPL